MKWFGLLRRIQQLEERARPATADGKIHVRFAHLQKLPHTYTGERHRRLVRGTPSENPDNGCLIKEFPGPGPDLHFDFEECGRIQEPALAVAKIEITAIDYFLGDEGGQKSSEKCECKRRVF